MSFEAIKGRTMFRVTDDIRAELRAGLGVFALSFVLMGIVTSFLMG